MNVLLMKITKTTSGRTLLYYLIVCMFLVSSLPNVASSSPLNTDEAVSSDFDRAATILEINTALDREDVRAQLDKMGYSVVEIKSRLDSLSNSELSQIAKKAGDLNNGGDGGLGIIITVLVIILIVIVIIIVVKRVGN